MQEKAKNQKKDQSIDKVNRKKFLKNILIKDNDRKILLVQQMLIEKIQKEKKKKKKKNFKKNIYSFLMNF